MQMTDFQDIEGLRRLNVRDYHTKWEQALEIFDAREREIAKHGKK